VLVVQLLRRGVRQQRREAGPDAMLEPPREVRGDLPVVARFAGRGHSGPYAAHAPFAVGHRAVLLRPCGRWQQHVCVRGGLAAGIRVLQYHQLGVLERFAHHRLRRHRMSRIRAHDPYDLDIAGA
jgi:hypothetical protein